MCKRREVYRGLESLLKLALCSAALSCTESTAPPVRSADEWSSAVLKSGAERKRNATSCPREPGETTFRIHYFKIGDVMLAPATIGRVERDGVVCCFKEPAERAELTKILASGTSPGVPADPSAEGAEIRVIVKVNDDTGEKVMAIVEQIWDPNDGLVAGVMTGVVHRNGMGQPISAAVMTDLQRLIETRCKWYGDP